MSNLSAIALLVFSLCFIPLSKTQTFDYLLDSMLNATACSSLFTTQKFPISDRDCDKATCDFPNEVCIITEAQSEALPNDRRQMSAQERILETKVMIVKRRIEHHRRTHEHPRNKRQAKSSNLHCEAISSACRSKVKKAIKKFKKAGGETVHESTATSKSKSQRPVAQPPAPLTPTPQPSPTPTPSATATPSFPGPAPPPGTPQPQPPTPSWPGTAPTPAPTPTPCPAPTPTPATWPMPPPSSGGGSYLRPPPQGYYRPQGSGYLHPPPGFGK